MGDGVPVPVSYSLGASQPEQTTAEISSITEHRRIRQLQSQTTLPGILWAVLIVGATITIMSSCLFGSDYPVLHMPQLVTWTSLLSLALVAIADINRPFQGSVHVEPTVSRMLSAFLKNTAEHKEHDAPPANRGYCDAFMG